MTPNMQSERRVTRIGRLDITASTIRATLGPIVIIVLVCFIAIGIGVINLRTALDEQADADARLANITAHQHFSKAVGESVLERTRTLQGAADEIATLRATSLSMIADLVAFSNAVAVKNDNKTFSRIRLKSLKPVGTGFTIDQGEASTLADLSDSSTAVKRRGFAITTTNVTPEGPVLTFKGSANIAQSIAP